MLKSPTSYIWRELCPSMSRFWLPTNTKQTSPVVTLTPETDSIHWVIYICKIRQCHTQTDKHITHTGFPLSYFQKNSSTSPGPPKCFPGRCRSTAIFKCKDKRQLLAENIQCHTTIHKSRPKAKAGEVLGEGQLTPGGLGHSPRSQTFCSILTATDDLWWGPNSTL